MAHRGFLREVFQLACLAPLLVEKSAKDDVPSAATYIEMSDPQGYLMPKRVVPVEPLPAQPAGYLPIIFSLASIVFSLLPDEFLWALAEYLAGFLLPPFARVMKCCLATSGKWACRALNRLRHRHVQHRTMSNVGTQTNPMAPQISTTENEAALTALKANHTAEMSQMWVRVYTATGDLRSERAGHSKLLENLRFAMDPRGHYANEEIEMAADAQARDLRRLSDLVEWKRRETKAALKKAEETTKLFKENRSLRGQLDSMTSRVENTKATAFHRERQLRNEVKQVATDTVSMSSYRAQIATIHTLQLAVAAADQKARDKEEEGRVAVERVQDDLTSVQSLVERLTNQAPDESSQAEAQLALETALENQRTAERNLEVSEKKVGESAAAISQLEQSLSKARDVVRLSSDNDQRLQERLDAALEALNEKQRPAAPDANFTSEIESLRSQLEDATSHGSEQYQNGYLAAIAQNPPADQGQEASTQTDHEENNGSGSGDGELRSEIEQLKAAKNELAQKLDTQKSQAEEAMLEAQRQAQEWVAATKAQVRDEAATVYNEQWAVASANHEAELQRVKDLGRQVENDRNAIAQQLLVAQQQLANNQPSTQEASETVIARAEAAEEEVEKFKKGKAAQDGRIKALHLENDTLRKNARSELEAAENTANTNDKLRATALTDELVNRHYDHPSRIAATQLMNANAKIEELKLFLTNSRNRYSQVTCLQILQDAEVDAAYKSLDEKNRVVLRKQCDGVNAKLMVLKSMMNNGVRDPTKAELLQEIYNARGDEQALWTDEEEPSSESSDEDEDDDDDNDNAGEGSSKGAPRSPFVPRPLATPRRPRPAGPSETPLPSDPRPNNALKRKEIGDNDDDNNGGEGSSKRNDTSEIGMRPITEPPQDNATSSAAAAPFAEGHTGFTFNAPRDIALAGPPGTSSPAPPPTTPAPAPHERIFTTGLLPLPGSSLTIKKPALPDKKAALPGLPAPSSSSSDDGAVDFLIGLGSASAARDSDEEAQEEADRIINHLAGRDEDDEDEAAFEASLYDYDDFD